MRILTTVLLVLISTGFTAVCTPASASPLSSVIEYFLEKFKVPEKRWETTKEVSKEVGKGVGKEVGKEVVPEVIKGAGKDDDKGAATGDVTLIAPFPMPPAGATGTAQVAETGKASVGQPIFIPPLGYFEVLSKSTASGPGTLTLRSLNNEG